jgi:hypothetical protein
MGRVKQFLKNWEMRKRPVVKFMSPREALGAQIKALHCQGHCSMTTLRIDLTMGTPISLQPRTVSANDLIRCVQEFEDMDQSVLD